MVQKFVLLQGASLQLAPPYYISTVLRGWQLKWRTLYLDPVANLSDSDASGIS